MMSCITVTVAVPSEVAARVTDPAIAWWDQLKALGEAIHQQQAMLVRSKVEQAVIVVDVLSPTERAT